MAKIKAALIQTLYHIYWLTFISHLFVWHWHRSEKWMTSRQRGDVAISLLCVSKCLLMSPTWEDAKSHWLHVCPFSPIVVSNVSLNGLYLICLCLTSRRAGILYAGHKAPDRGMGAKIWVGTIKPRASLLTHQDWPTRDFGDIGAVWKYWDASHQTEGTVLIRVKI